MAIKIFFAFCLSLFPASDYQSVAEVNNLPGKKFLNYNIPGTYIKTNTQQGFPDLKKGMKAPQIVLQGQDNNTFDLYAHDSNCRYILLIFWSADCQHCKELISSLYPLSMQPEYRERLEVVTISLDETDTEIMAWRSRLPELYGWKHLRLEEGVRSSTFIDYGISYTPAMFLLDAETMLIKAIPKSAVQIKRRLRR
ncbi:MAG: redoxin domain-containing protein [Bacteroidales bacterium]|nr:redoxin domain-containing protein [Bacteroidales bacterium]